MRKRLHGLGWLQSEVMDLVWQQGEATVAQLVEAISQRRPVTYTTVLSAMQKLEKKGWLKHRSEGRAYVYSPKRQREEVGGRLLSDILKSTFQGNPRLLLASLLDEQRLSDKELAELRGEIDKRRKENRRG